MSHETPTLAASKRDHFGTRYARRLRQQGQLPAVVYGHQRDTVHISIDATETINHLLQGVHLFTVNIEGEPETCLVKELQFGYLGDNVMHVDFARVDLNEEVTVNVSLSIHGEPESIRRPGAILSQQMTDLEVICLASQIPSEIKVDISEMDELFIVANLKLPAGIRTEVGPETPIVSVTFIAEVEEAEEVEVVGEDEPDVITEAEKEDEGDKAAD